MSNRRIINVLLNYKKHLQKAIVKSTYFSMVLLKVNRHRLNKTKGIAALLQIEI